MERHDVPRGRDPVVQGPSAPGKGGTCVVGTKEKGFTGLGDRGADGTRRETVALAPGPICKVSLTH